MMFGKGVLVLNFTKREVTRLNLRLKQSMSEGKGWVESDKIWVQK
jgi:hypothetical protein